MVKFTRSILVLSITVLALSLSMVWTSSAAGVDYSSMFTQAVNSDGAFAEQASVNLGNAFSSNPLAFIKAASVLPESQLEKVANLVVYNASYKDLNKFDGDIVKLKKSKGLLPQDLKVLDYISKSIVLLKSQNTESAGPAPTQVDIPKFDPETLMGFIKAHKDMNNNVDEEYFETLGNAYRADSKLFAKTISTLPAEDIMSVSKFVAYDCQKKNYKQSNLSNSNISLTPRENDILNTISAEVSNSSNIGTNQSTLAPSALITATSLNVPTIGSMSYSSTPLVAGDSETLKVTFSESTAIYSTRSYWVQVYGIRNGVSYLKASQSVTIPYGSSSTTASFGLNFTSTGPFYTLVKVYSSYGGTLLTQRQGSYPDTVYGRWKINIKFPVNRNYLGSLALYNADGSYVFGTSALGRSVDNTSQLVTYGNTPTGEYSGFLGYASSYASGATQYSFGRLNYKVVLMTGVSGNIVQSGRSGIWIHAGDTQVSTMPYSPLRPTHGCVRVKSDYSSTTNDMQVQLQQKIETLINSSYHYNTGVIKISES